MECVPNKTTASSSRTQLPIGTCFISFGTNIDHLGGQKRMWPRLMVAACIHQAPPFFKFQSHRNSWNHCWTVHSYPVLLEDLMDESSSSHPHSPCCKLHPAPALPWLRSAAPCPAARCLDCVAAYGPRSWRASPGPSVWAVSGRRYHRRYDMWYEYEVKGSKYEYDLNITLIENEYDKSHVQY